mgnify:CR=1 FL=1
MKTPMTAEEAIAWMIAHPYGERDQNGVDVGLLRHFLRMTPLERIRHAEDAARSMERLHERFRPDAT